MKTAYINGVVYTGRNEFEKGFVVEDDKFIYVGNNDEAKSIGEKVIDLNGKFVCAGFNDSHMHLLNYGHILNQAQFFDHTSSLKDMIDYLKDYVKSHPVNEGMWIKGRGWNQDYFEDVKRMPSLSDLDEVSKDIPILATRVCGHCLVVNSKALEVLGIDENTICPSGGKIELQEGRFYDNAMDLVYNAVPDPDEDTIKQYILSACKALNAYGVTSSQSDDYCAFRNVDTSIIDNAYKELEKEGKLTVRVYEQANLTSLDALKKYIEKGCKTGVGSNMFKIGPLKMLGDGSLGARTAYMSKPYNDDPSTRGFSVFSQKEFDETISYANKNDMNVAIHTIGDACVDQVLEAIEKALKEYPRDNHRHAIVHCQITRADQLDKIAKLKLHIFAQSIFLDYDINIVEDRVGKDLASTSYSWKSLMNKGVNVSNGTDCPVELPDALRGIECAITRCTIKDHKGPYLKHEAFTVSEAIDSYTIQSAIGSLEEDYKGLIKEGYLADFVVLESNPFEIDAFDIHKIKVLETYLGGKKVL